ncbi:MAG TPA: hypothetical protein VFC78_09975 [Tepidisphaeraceae bacterium]|nr:hypothetical protein [Tepidisphaeraceae bacterium]
MSTLELAELLPQLGELTPGVAGRWIAAALAQAAALHEHDGWLYPIDPARQPGAERLHDAWREWAHGAEALVRQAESLQYVGQEIPGLDQLRDSVGWAQAMTAMPPALIAQRRRQAHEGDVYSVEEVRRELRAGFRRACNSVE